MATLGKVVACVALLCIGGNVILLLEGRMTKETWLLIAAIAFMLYVICIR